MLAMADTETQIRDLDATWKNPLRWCQGRFDKIRAIDRGQRRANDRGRNPQGRWRPVHALEDAEHLKKKSQGAKAGSAVKDGKYAIRVGSAGIFTSLPPFKIPRWISSRLTIHTPRAS